MLIFNLTFVVSVDIHRVELCDICLFVLLLIAVDLIFGNPKNLTWGILISIDKWNPFLLKITQILPI